MNKTPPLARILIVEDEVLLALHLQFMLEKLGYTVVAQIASGEQAIQNAMTLHPDVILMDINLAGVITGIEAAAEIQARLAIPIIYTTGYSKEFVLQKNPHHPPAAYLNKPISARELGTTLEKVLSPSSPTETE